MSRGCAQENCTVGETGTCLLNNDPATCPNRKSIADQVAPLKEPKKRPRFPSSLTLTSERTAEIMASRYCRLIGILGAPNAGKTAAVVSLYLLLAQGKLRGIHFRDSRSLLAFDELSHGARLWNEGQLPEQLTAHTELAEDREAGFLHLRLSTEGGKPSDLLLPDLPGEWTTSLIETNRHDRLKFMKGADVIWLMVDGRQLSDPESRQWAIHRMQLLVQRLADLIAKTTPVLLVVTHQDAGTPDAAAIGAISAEASAQGLSMKVQHIASFAVDGRQVPPGTGIRELILASLHSSAAAPKVLWPENTESAVQDRAMMRFRLRRDP
jgi:hypothetical protein